MYDELVKTNFDEEYLKEHNGLGRFIEKSIILEITNMYKGMVALQNTIAFSLQIGDNDPGLPT